MADRCELIIIDCELRTMTQAKPPKKRNCGPEDVTGLMRTILSAEDEDITCDECYEHIDQYVDMPEVGRRCGDCATEGQDPS